MGGGTMMLRPRLFLVSAILWAVATASLARAGEPDRFSALEENDSLLFNSDKHYTQGVRFAYVPPGATSLGFLDDLLPTYSPQATHRYAFMLGQSIFTPKNLMIKPPDPNDRPYGGWLYAGVSLLQEHDSATPESSSLENLELELGVVGPFALGKQVQNNFHQLIGKAASKGWSNQLQNEPGAVLSYEWLRRVPIPNLSWVDVVPQAGATLGNVFTYGDVGALLRIGTDLTADYGPVRIRPSLSGTDYFTTANLSGKGGGYFYVGAQGRVVGQNIFLDGNTLRQSPSVSKKPLVADLEVGFSAFWTESVRFDLSVVRRTQEFEGQHGLDVIETAALTVSW
jgi:lipid A 3-O-deacylase